MVIVALKMFGNRYCCRENGKFFLYAGKTGSFFYMPGRREVFLITGRWKVFLFAGKAGSFFDYRKMESFFVCREGGKLFC